MEFLIRVGSHTLFSWGEWGVSVVDPVVGRLPRPQLLFWAPRGYRLNIGEHSTRNTGNKPAKNGRPLTLAVGDSFTFGEDVDDEDAWPAVLERLTDRRVINAGVPGFGLDQAVLRAEQLAGIYTPEIIVASFIPNDIMRCEMSYHSGHAKPYFEIDSSGLSLHPAPVSQRPFLKRLFSPSIVVDLLLDRRIMWDGPSVGWAHHRGREVACLLMKRLAELGRLRGSHIIVMAQIEAPTWSADDWDVKNAVLACAEANQLSVLDIFPTAARLSEKEREELFAGSGHGHMNAAGNALVAAELARFLSNRAVPSS